MASHARQEINEFMHLAPQAYAALTALSKATREFGPEAGVLEMVKVRASQINGCAFCLQFHLNLARREQVEQPKLDQLPVWRESTLYSERERAALAWTEALTRLTQREVSDEAFELAKAQFTDIELAHLSAAIGLINAWNRMGVAYRWAPPPSNP